MFLPLSTTEISLEILKNIISLGCPRKNVQNTNIQFKKDGNVHRFAFSAIRRELLEREREKRKGWVNIKIR